MHEPPEVQAALAKYTVEIAAQTRAARKYVRGCFPRGYELVYDNYNALGFGYGGGTKATDVRVSVVAYPRWVTLFFLYGASLEDPDGMLEGAGSRVRSVRLVPPSLVQSPAIVALLEQELRRSSPVLAVAPPLTTVVKRVSEKQRPRAPARKAAPRNKARSSAADRA